MPKRKKTAPIKTTCICLLIVFFFVDTSAQIQTPQAPKFGTFQQAPEQSYPKQKSNPNNQQSQQYKQQQQLKELYDVLHEDDRKRTINYSFPSLSYLQETRGFYNAYKTIDSMLLGLQPLNLKKAVYVVEHAYDNKLSYSKFNGQIKYLVDVCKQKMLKEGISPNNREAVNMVIYQVLCDTVDVQNPKTKVYYKSYPFHYDFDDFRGEKDFSKMFVSKLLRTHTGNCHSMPLLYLIIAEELKTEAFLTFAPEHSFLRFQDNNRNWVNVELTNGRLSSDAWVLGSGYIKSEALNIGIYLDTIDKKQTIAAMLFDLAKEHIAKIGMDGFVLKCVNRSLEIYPNNIFFIMEKADYYTVLLGYVVAQKGRPPLEKIKQDQQAWSIYQQRNQMYDIIDNSGYMEMPKEAYEEWRKSEDAGCKKRNK